jgi:hypothetical protein
MPQLINDVGYDWQYDSHEKVLNGSLGGGAYAPAGLNNTTISEAQLVPVYFSLRPP